MRKKWSSEEIEYLTELYEKNGLSLSEIYPVFSKKYNRTLESVKIKIKKLTLKHTNEQTKKIKSRLSQGELNNMYGKISPLRGLNKKNSEIIKNASKKNSETKKTMYKNGLLPDINGNKNPMYGIISWNNGLNKLTDERIKKYGEKVSKSKKTEWINKSDEEKNKIIERLNDARIKSLKPTKIENKIEDYIKSLNIIYKKNYRIDKFLVDFYLIDYNLVIECDGDYWHSNPGFYDFKNLDKIQIKNKDRDKRKEEMLKKSEIKFIRFWEFDIHNSFDVVSEKIKNTINQ